MPKRAPRNRRMASEKPCPKPKAACSGQTCRQRERSSIMRNVCRIRTAVRMPAEGSLNALSAPRSTLRHACWPQCRADQACPPLFRLPHVCAHRRIRKQNACRAMSGRAVCSEHPLARVTCLLALCGHVHYESTVLTVFLVNFPCAKDGKR